MDREIPLYTLEGVTGAEKTYHYFSTGDGLGLSLNRFHRADSDDIVLIIHGLTTSTDMFVMPEHYNLVQYLLDQGFGDVFTVDFRMSNHWIYNLGRHRFTMDDIAMYDFPAALEKVREVAGDRRIHVICHCLGSVSFLMSLAAKQVDGIASVIANSAGLTPKVPAFSKLKASVGPTLFEHVLGMAYISPSWNDDPGFHRGKLISKLVSLFHRECDVPACHMLSLMWGSGWPALYLHENLDETTHRRGGDLYGPVNVHYHRHVIKMLNAGNKAVKYNTREARHASLPNNYLRSARDITTPILFVSGDTNRVFADSNKHCHAVMERLAPGRHSYHEFPDYGHQDVFMGKNVAQDIFPTFVDWIRDWSKPGARSTSVSTAPAR